jgi:hypothetical protein
LVRVGYLTILKINYIVNNKVLFRMFKMCNRMNLTAPKKPNIVYYLNGGV